MDTEKQADKIRHYLGAANRDLRRARGALIELNDAYERSNLFDQVLLKEQIADVIKATKITELLIENKSTCTDDPPRYWTEVSEGHEGWWRTVDKEAMSFSEAVDRVNELTLDTGQIYRVVEAVPVKKVTAKQVQAMKKLERFYESLADDMMKLTDAELLAELKEAGEDPKAIAAKTRKIVMDAIATYDERGK